MNDRFRPKADVQISVAGNVIIRLAFNNLAFTKGVFSTRLTTECHECCHIRGADVLNTQLNIHL